MSHDDITPAIRREFEQPDIDAEVIREVENSCTFHRGLGNSGRRLQLVEYDCPKCSHDRMLRIIRVYPESRDSVEYYCQNPACPYYTDGIASWVGEPYPPEFPIIWSQTAYCPDCGDKHTVTIDQRGLNGLELNEFFRDDYTHEALCKDCQANRAERRAGV